MPEQYLVAPPFGGMDFDADGALLPKDKLSLAVNARFDKGAVTRRKAVANLAQAFTKTPALVLANNTNTATDYLNVPLAAAFATSPSFTVSFWFKYVLVGSNPATTDLLFQCRNSGGALVAWKIECINTSQKRYLKSTTYYSGSSPSFTTSALTSGVWYWIVLGVGDSGAGGPVSVLYQNGIPIRAEAGFGDALQTGMNHVRVFGHPTTANLTYNIRNLKISTVDLLDGSWTSYPTIGASIISKYEDAGETIGGTTQQYRFTDDPDVTATDSMGVSNGSYNGTASSTYASIADYGALYSPTPISTDAIESVYGSDFVWLTATDGIYRYDLVAGGIIRPKLLIASGGQSDYAVYAGVTYTAPGDGKVYQHHALATALQGANQATAPVGETANVSGAKLQDWIAPLLNSYTEVPITLDPATFPSAGNVEIGTYTWKLTAYSDYTGEETAVLSTLNGTVSASSKLVRFVVNMVATVAVPYMPHITHLRLWRTKVGPGSTWYLAATVKLDPGAAVLENSLGRKIDDNTADASLSTITLDTGITVNPTMNRIEVYRDRLWGASGTDAKLYYSALGVPWKFNTTTRVIQIGEDTDPIQRLHEFGGNLYIFKRDSVHVLRGVTDDDFSVDILFRDVGCSSPWSLVESQGVLYWVSADKVYTMQGGAWTEIGRPIRHFLGVSNEATLVAAFHEAEQTYVIGAYYNARWDDAGEGTTADRCDISLVYDTKAATWSVDTVPLCGVADIPIGMTNGGSLVGVIDAVFGTSGGTTYASSSLIRYLDQAADYAATHKIADLADSTTTTQITKAGAFSTFPGAVGRYVVVSDGFTNDNHNAVMRRITGSSLNVVNIGATYPFESAAQRYNFGMGSIPLVIETGWLTFDTPGLIKRLQHMQVHWNEAMPDAEATEHFAYFAFFAETHDPFEYEGDTDTFTIFDGTGSYKPRDLFLSTKTNGLQSNSRWTTGVTVDRVNMSSFLVRTRADMYFRWLKVRMIVPHAPREFALRALEFHYTECGL